MMHTPLTSDQRVRGDYVGGTLDHWARVQGRGSALIMGDTALSWTSLNDRSRALAEHLYARGLSGGAVALDMRDPMHLIQAFLGIVRAGARAQVFDPGWTASQRQAILEGASPQHLLTDDTVDPWFPPQPDIDVPTPQPDQPFYVGFTSGSTGLPKGYRRTHASWLASFELSAELFDFRPDDIVMAPGSLATSLHLYGVIHALQSGLSAVLAPSFRPRTLLQTLTAQGVTVLYGTPTQIQLLIQAADRYQLGPWPGLRHLIVSGAKWPDALRARIDHHFPNACVSEFYGTSEMSFVALHNDRAPAPSGSVGRPVPGVQVRIGPDPQSPLPPGDRGRIWVKSDLLFDDYECGGGDEIRRQDGWLTVGDHGFLDTDQNLYLVGREKRMLVSSGQNLYPEELETDLLDHPGVAHAAVLGVPDPLRGQRIVALVQLQDPALTPDELRRHCARQRPLAQCPRQWFVLDDWPLTGSGKTDFVALEQRLERLVRDAEASIS